MALYLFVKKKRWAYWRVLDVVVVPTALAAVFIRIGNFMNQEILGTASTLPWAVVFMHPADGSAVIPRHPVQLYEAAWYLFSFCILLWYWRSHFSKQIMGKVSGLFLLLIFGFRFVIEAFKLEQSAYLSQGAFLTMGQYLSLPFIALGLWLFFFRRESR
jgi:prolipoprotein diacylglyceryl transferase